MSINYQNVGHSNFRLQVDDLAFSNFHRSSQFAMQTLAKVVLILVNIGFIVAGSLLIWLGSKSRDGHWSDIFSTGTATDVSTVSAVVMALGASVILIALFGLTGAACRNRCLLTLYSIFVVVGLIIFVAIAVLGFMSTSQANTWTAKAFPADPAETDVAKGFNQVYCYAEGGRFCVTSSVKDAVNTFFPSVGQSGIDAFVLAGVDVTANTGLIGLCDQVNAKLTSSPALSSALPKEYKDACATCQDVKTKYGEYSSLFDWVESQCPLTQETAQWCGKFLLTKNQTSLYDGAPYKQCRAPVLGLWKDYGTKVGIGGVVLAVVSMVLIVFSCKAARSQDNDGYSGA
ncbi:hypothetical protein DYB37_003707 [Aphanomyces astaci]|uniref:Tetraspanin n=3 Tax=Aphanomyces astaci TaxID=112090 RepID=A0A397FHH4_APHAT|nr:hypothetical protein DYB36_009302 [Aphanomyces astaci]RHY20008.1 hypothetical protein DYB25_001860 [Aphanomyces astaci]RHY37981.1 hypothetical protein DYB34_009118 [Aphanomyces astaci]RHY77592.1 hypothetical protein DYB38_012146 [Aphanomyces astaci]RHZ03010.1 hypothetical protein DYB35_003951 [Aphanomyces astaci]